MSASSASIVPWDRLVRYLPEGDAQGPARYGEPILANGSEDVGDLARSGHLKVKVLEGSGPFDVKPTDRVEKVGKLLGPLTPEDVPIIRCIGLNYTTHSEPISPLPPSLG